MNTTTMQRTAPCPRCRAPHQFEVCDILPRIVPLCDPCGEQSAAEWKADRKEVAWQKLYRARLPSGYWMATPERVAGIYASALDWCPSKHHGGLGLIGATGKGKSCALACVLAELRQPFRWWSGTEARDAAIQAATADRDRAAAREQWERAMTVPVLILDDISQSKFTESWSSSLFDLLETRLGGNLPTFWTSQIDLDDLRAKILRQNGGDEEQAAAISRRLAQHSLILKP
jgi:hypothetical protein